MKTVYLDNAATTMIKPECVVEAVTCAMTSMGNDGRGAHGNALTASRIIYDTRVKLAKLFNCEGPEQVVFTANSTESLNIAIKGILKAGDHVITTELEHNSVLRPLYEMKNRGVELTIIKSDKQGNLCYEDIDAAIKENTKAIITTHGSNLTGNLVDIKSIGSIAKKHNLLYMVDGSQTAGIFPIDVRDMNIDVLAFTGHKSLLGPQGTGGLYVKKKVDITPLLSGGSGIDTYNKRHPQVMPTALEAGTLNGHGIAGLNAALTYINETGLDKIREKALSLMWVFYNGIKDLNGVKIYGDFSKEERCPVVALNIESYDSSMVSDALYSEFGICTRPGAHCAPLMHYALGTEEQGAVRFSFSHLNTMDEVEFAISAIKQLIGEI